MDLVTVLSLGALLVVVAALVLVAVMVVLGRRAAGERRLEEELAASRAELAALRARLDELAREVRPAAEATASPGFVITSLPGAAPAPSAEVSPSSSSRSSSSPSSSSVAPGLTVSEFAAVVVTEAVVKVVALTHGVRRALSPANRNRIRFEVGREVTRSRKQRRRELREARRLLRADPDLLARERAAQPTGHGGRPSRSRDAA